MGILDIFLTYQIPVFLSYETEVIKFQKSNKYEAV